MFSPDLLPTVLVAGFVNAGLYGFLPIAIILSYRISRTIAFVHGGIAAVGALGYWLLSVQNDFLADYIVAFGGGQDPATWGSRPELPPLLALAIVVVLGAVIGGVYGAIVMSRKVAALPVITLTIVSLGAMMGLIGIVGYLNVQPDFFPQSPFGTGSYLVGDVTVTRHNLIAFGIVAGLSVVLAVLLTRTHTGLVIRALADDQEAGVWCGINLREVGTLVYAGSGAAAALAGALIAVRSGAHPEEMILLFLIGLGLAAVGGLRSLPLAFAGALLFSYLETALIVGLFGAVSRPTEALVLYGSLFGVILLAAKFRRESVFLLERQSL